MKKYLRVAVTALGLGLAAHASAVPVTFDLGNDSTIAITSFTPGPICEFFGCGANVAIDPNLGSLSNTLIAGQSWDFDFFTLEFYGIGGGTGNITGSLAFDLPSTALNANGSGFGAFFTIGLSTGDLTWSAQPGQFLLDDGTAYSVIFQDRSGAQIGSKVKVGAKLTLNTEPGAPVGVPAPGALSLLGLGLLGLGIAARRRANRRSI